MKTFFDTLLSPWCPPHAIRDLEQQQLGGETNRFQYVVVKHLKKGRKTIAIHDTLTGDLTPGDSLKAIITKVCLLTIGTPFYGAGTMIWNAGLIPYHIIRSSFSALGAIFSRDLESFGQHTYSILSRPCYDLWNIVRTPFFQIGLMLAIAKGCYEGALYDAKKFYEARAVYASIEKDWAHGISFLNDIRFYVNHRDFNRIKTCYGAFCFQTRASSIDPAQKKYNILLEGNSLEEAQLLFRMAFPGETLNKSKSDR